MGLIVAIIHYALQIFSFVVIAKVLVSYFMSPDEPIRRTLDNVVEPALAPIRRIMPQTGMVDFSPMVLLLLIWVLDAIIVRSIR
jgi:YggT family protein